MWSVSQLLKAHPSHLCTPALPTSRGVKDPRPRRTLDGACAFTHCAVPVFSGSGVMFPLDRFPSVVMSTPGTCLPGQHWAVPGGPEENRPDVIPVLGAGNQASSKLLQK